MSNDFVDVTKQLVRDEREANRSRRRNHKRAEAEHRAILLEKRGKFAIALQALSSAFLEPENKAIRYLEPRLIVHRRFSMFSVAGYTLDYGNMHEPRLHVSLTGDFYYGYEGQVTRIDPWKLNFKDLRRFTWRLYEQARDKDILGDLIIEIP